MSALSIGFTGTQTGWTHMQQFVVIARMKALRKDGAEWMHNGDCVGSDYLAARAWKDLGGKIHLHPPELKSKRAFIEADAQEPARPYLMRNSRIARSCSVLIATPATVGEVTRSGTWSTIRMARKLGKPIYIIGPNGAETFEDTP